MTQRKLDPADFHINRWPMERYSFAKLDRKVRREALTEIFDALGTKTIRQRLQVARKVIHEIKTHRFDSEDLWRQNQSEWRSWFSEVAAHSQALADLAAAYPKNFARVVMTVKKNQHAEVQNVIDILRGWAERTRGIGTSEHPLPRGGTPDIGPLLLIDSFKNTYQAATGKAVSRETNRVTGQPNSPFVRFMHGVWRLAGTERSYHAIDKEMRRWKRWSETGVIR